jgi:hypothetical protein
MQPKHRTWNPRYDKHSSRRRHCHDPKGLGAEAFGSGVHNVLLALSFQAPINIFRNTTEGLCNVTIQYTASDEAAELCPTLGSKGVTPSSGKEASSDIAI